MVMFCLFGDVWVKRVMMVMLFSFVDVWVVGICCMGVLRRGMRSIVLLMKLFT